MPEPESRVELAETAGVELTETEPAEALKPVREPTSRPFDTALTREWTRVLCVSVLLGTFVLAVVGLFVLVLAGKLAADVLVQSVFPTLATLVSAALAFYFGTKSQES